MLLRKGKIKIRYGVGVKTRPTTPAVNSNWPIRSNWFPIAPANAAKSSDPSLPNLRYR